VALGVDDTCTWHVRPADVALDFVDDPIRLSEVADSLRREQSADGDAVDGLRRIEQREIEEAGSQAGLIGEVPELFGADGREVDGRFEIRVRPAVKEFEDAMLAGVLAGVERTPCGGSDRRRDTPERTGDSLLLDSLERRKFAGLDQRLQDLLSGAI